MEALIPALCPGEMQLLTDVVPAGTHVVLADPEKIRARAHDLVRTGQEFLEASWMAAAGGGKAPIDLGASGVLGDRRRRRASARIGIIRGGRCRS